MKNLNRRRSITATTVATLALASALAGCTTDLSPVSATPRATATQSAAPVASPSGTPGVLANEVAVADGRYIVMIDPSWETLDIPGMSAMYDELGEWGGAWQMGEPGDLMVMIAVLDGDVTDEMMQQTVIGAIRGGAGNVGADASSFTLSEDFGETDGGLRTLKDSATIPVEGGDVATSIHVVDLDDALLVIMAAGAADEDIMKEVTSTVVGSLMES